MLWRERYDTWKTILDSSVFWNMNVIVSQDSVLKYQTSFPEQNIRVQAEKAGHKTSSGEKITSWFSNPLSWVRDISGIQVWRKILIAEQLGPSFTNVQLTLLFSKFVKWREIISLNAGLLLLRRGTFFYKPKLYLFNTKVVESINCLL